MQQGFQVIIRRLHSGFLKGFSSFCQTAQTGSTYIKNCLIPKATMQPTQPPTVTYGQLRGQNRPNQYFMYQELLVSVKTSASFANVSDRVFQLKIILSTANSKKQEHKFFPLIQPSGLGTASTQLGPQRTLDPPKMTLPTTL